MRTPPDARRQAGRELVGELSEGELLVFGLALYAGEGAKTDGSVRLPTATHACALCS